MKSLLLAICLLLPITSHADFGSGMVVGMMMSSGGDETVINIKDGGHPCMITLKKTGGTFQLNANYIESMEDISLRTNCKSSGFLSQSCEQVMGSRIALINKEAYKTFSSGSEIKEQIKTCTVQASK